MNKKNNTFDDYVEEKMDNEEFEISYEHEKINLDETGKDIDNVNNNFKENVIENIPNKEFRIKPINNINKKIGKSVANSIKNKAAYQHNKIIKNKKKNRMARISRRKNRT